MHIYIHTTNDIGARSWTYNSRVSIEARRREHILLVYCTYLSQKFVLTYAWLFLNKNNICRFYTKTQNLRIYIYWKTSQINLLQKNVDNIFNKMFCMMYDIWLWPSARENTTYRRDRGVICRLLCLYVIMIYFCQNIKRCGGNSV